MLAAAELVEANAKRLVPVRTGELRAAIDHTLPYQLETGMRTVAVGVRRPTSRRAHFIEFGTVHNSAQPFLRPALDAGSRPAVSLMGRILNLFIERGEAAAPVVTTKLNIKIGE